MTFLYVSGAGTDSTERGRIMWPASKGKTENDLLKLPFRAAYMFRPASSSPPRHPLQDQALPVLLHHPQSIFPSSNQPSPNTSPPPSSSVALCLQVANTASQKPILESRDIDTL